MLGMCKVDNRKYTLDRKELNAHQLIIKYERKRGRYSRKFKSYYIPLVVDYKGETVRLFLIKYRGSKKWTLLLTSNLAISFTQAIELYQIRWSIEVLFKECKQYLRLGRSQNTDFDGQIADATLTLVTYTILALQKRFGSYETMGVLFRGIQQELLELTLWERLIRQVIKMVMKLIEVLDVDPEEIIEKLIKSDETSRKLMFILSALTDGGGDNYQNNIKNDIAYGIAS